MRKTISKCFTFEAAHFLNHSNNIKNKNIHGHSFHVEVFISGVIGKDGFIIDFSKLEKDIHKIKEKLDHNFLNDIDGLGTPTLENIGIWLWSLFIKKHSNLSQIVIKRKSCGESFTISK